MECDAAMATFNATTNPAQAGLFDLRGAVTKKAVGTGEKLCICFGLDHTRTEALGMFSCLLVGEAGQVMERKATFGGNTAVGLTGPETNKGKLLPKCEELALKNSTSSGTTSMYC